MNKQRGIAKSDERAMSAAAPRSQPAPPQADEDVVDLEALPLTSYVILGLLTTTDELTVAEVQSRAHRSIRFFYGTPALSHIRRDLNRLDDLGYVSAREVRQGRVKQTLKYRVTDIGERALREWAESGPFDSAVVKNPVLMRLWLGRRAGDKDKVLRYLEDQIAQVEAELVQLAALIASTIGTPGLRDKLAGVEWSITVLQHVQRVSESNLESLRDLLKELRELSR